MDKGIIVYSSMEYYSIMKRNELMIHGMTSINHMDIMFRKS